MVLNMCQKLGVQICTNTLDLTYSMTDFFPFFSAASHFLGDVHAPHSPPQHGRCPFWPLARAPKAAHRRRRRASGATTAPTRHFQPPARSLPPPLLLVRSWSGILPLSAQWARATVSGVNVHNDDRGTPRPISWAIHPPHPPTHPPIHPPTHLPTRPPTPALTPPAPCHRPPPSPTPSLGMTRKLAYRKGGNCLSAEYKWSSFYRPSKLPALSAHRLPHPPHPPTPHPTPTHPWE